MRKLLALMLVLGLASVANAHFIYTVDGKEQPAVVEIRQVPSGMIELDLELSADEMINSYTLDYKLSNAQAEILIDQMEYPIVFDFESGTQMFNPQWVQVAGGQFLSDPVEGPGVIFQKMYIHCLEDTDVVLDIVVAGTTEIGETGFEMPYQVGDVVHTLTIKQIPEPATMLLLGLGGLFLRRRK